MALITTAPILTPATHLNSSGLAKNNTKKCCKSSKNAANDISTPAKEARELGGTRVCVSWEVVRSNIQRPRRERERVVKRMIVRVMRDSGAANLERRRLGGEDVVGERLQRTRTTGIY